MKKLLCVLLCLILVFTAVYAVSPSLSAISGTDELEAEIDKLDSEIAANRKKLNSLKGDQKKQKEYLDTLEKQIETVEEKATGINTQIQKIDSEIDKLNTEIKQISKEIVQTEKDIVKAQTNIENTSDLLSAKLRSAYLNGNNSTLKILMGADSLASFLTGLELMKRTTESDKKVIEDFRDEVVTLKKSKVKLEEDQAAVSEKKTTQIQKKSELTAKQKEYDKTVESLEGQYAEIEKYVAELDKSSAAYEQYIKELQQERADADAEIDRILSEYYATSTTLPAANNQDGTTSAVVSQGSAGPAYVSGESWAWPLGNQQCYISSPYGNRSASISGWSFHGGVDISGGGFYGRTIYASRSGKVITAVNGSTGYGKYLIIDHGDGYSSLYAHNSALLVSTGASVKKGQPIAKAGSSGNSTGPHLHFEVRYYGEKKNPMNFVKKP